MFDGNLRIIGNGGLFFLWPNAVAVEDVEGKGRDGSYGAFGGFSHWVDVAGT